jgi:hypothetical protein
VRKQVAAGCGCQSAGIKKPAGCFAILTQAARQLRANLQLVHGLVVLQRLGIGVDSPELDALQASGRNKQKKTMRVVKTAEREKGRCHYFQVKSTQKHSTTVACRQCARKQENCTVDSFFRLLARSGVAQALRRAAEMTGSALTVRPLEIMRLTALPPPPPQPMTLMAASPAFREQGHKG